MRLIDSNADVYPYVETWRCNCSEYGVQNVMSVDDVSTLPEIDPETLPIVRELRAQLAKITAERDAAVSDLKHSDNCDICKFVDKIPDKCNYECLECELDCKCNSCRNESNWEWRGVSDKTNKLESLEKFFETSKGEIYNAYQCY